MFKKLVAALSAALLVLALPTVAQAWESPTGDVRSNTLETTTASGVPVKVAVAANGTGEITAEPTDTEASNAQPVDGYTKVGSFHIYDTGNVEAPFNFSYNIGSQFANADVIVYIDHQGEGGTEVVKKTASSDGTVTFSTDNLSIHTVCAKPASGSAAGATTDKSSKSPQTGLNTPVVAGVTAAAAVAAAGVAVALKKARN